VLLAYEFLPGADREYSQELIATESLEITNDVRRWDQVSYRDVHLGADRAVELCVTRTPERRHYLVTMARGTLVIHYVGALHRPERDGALAVVATRLLDAFKTSRGGLQRVEQRLATERPPPLKSSPPVPTTLEGCLAELRRVLDHETLAEMRRLPEADMIRYHHGLGARLRHQWGLRAGSPLATFFERLGVSDPDDMSGIILTSFWRHLHDRPLDLETQVKRRRERWDRPPTPPGP
jgi:hypothetical protein